MRPFSRIRKKLYPLRHEIALRFEPRTNFTFTRFLRLPHQFEVLTSHVIDRLLPAGMERPLRIAIVGSSIGAGAYTIASVLEEKRAELKYRIYATDINPGVVAYAREGRYTAEEVLAKPGVPPEFVARTFDRVGDHFLVREQLREHVEFGIADVLSADLMTTVGTADVVFCQNLLVNLPLRAARRAFANVVQLVRHPGALMLDGMPLRLRARLTHGAGLEPITALIDDVHAEVRRLHGEAWPWHYWGVEQLDRRRRHWEWRYATVFMRA